MKASHLVEAFETKQLDLPSPLEVRKLLEHSKLHSPMELVFQLVSGEQLGLLADSQCVSISAEL